MTVVLTSDPRYPRPGAGTRARLTVTTVSEGEAGNFVRLWATAAPVGSPLRARLDAEGKSRVEVFAGSVGTAFELQTDVSGAYVFAAQEYNKNASTVGGGYEGSPDGFESETKVGAEQTVSAYVGSRMTTTVGTGAHTATLVLWVWNGTIRRTTVESHGEASPAIVNPSSTIAATAAASANVVTALAALRDVTVSTATGDVFDVINNIAVKLNAHMLESGVHAANDEDNDINGAYSSPTSPEAMKLASREVATRLYRHITNDSGSGVATAAYHQSGGNTVTDWLNLPQLFTPGDIGQAVYALGAMWTAYESHRANDTVHDAADSTNTLSALPPLLTVYRRFAEAVQSAGPAAPVTSNPGAVALAHGAGFREG